MSVQSITPPKIGRSSSCASSEEMSIFYDIQASMEDDIEQKEHYANAAYNHGTISLRSKYIIRDCFDKIIDIFNN